jgi:hypothetical protein
MFNIALNLPVKTFCAVINTTQMIRLRSLGLDCCLHHFLPKYLPRFRLNIFQYGLIAD